MRASPSTGPSPTRSPNRRPDAARPAADRPRDLLPGDEVTGTGTPDGPAYTVDRVDTARGLLVLDDGTEVPLGSPTDRVLARRPVPGPRP